MKKSENVNKDDIVLYTTAYGCLYVGKVISVDKENNIAYVWYGIDNIAAATQLDRIYNCRYEEINRLPVENADIVEFILLNNYCDGAGDALYSQSLHNVIRAFNENGYSYKINELDYLLRMDGTLETFAKIVNALNRLVIAEERKKNHD